MASRAQFAVEHIAPKPRGWRVRTVTPKRSGHEVRIAFPPGRRRKGSGKVLEVLHPKGEKNPKCAISQIAKSNPAELLIFGNPSAAAAKRATRERAGKIRAARLNGRPNAGHKPGCPCFACKHQRAVKKMVGKMPKPVRAVFDRNPRRRRHNPDETEQAVQLFEAFHGKNARSIVEKHVSAAIRQDYTALGDLIYLKVKTPVGGRAEFRFDDDGVKLASSPDGKQLYCIGGKQNLLPLLDSESQQKDFIDLGECQEVCYLARKIHSNFEPVEWYHKFGENSGVKPQLMFDKLKKQIFFIGGEYSINPNVDVSPGIEN